MSLDEIEILGLKLSTEAKEARDAMFDTSKSLTACDFSHEDRASIVCEDGSLFTVNSSFIKEWESPNTNKKWIFVFSEHYPSMLFSADDLLFWCDNRGHHGQNRTV